MMQMKQYLKKNPATNVKNMQGKVKICNHYKTYPKSFVGILAIQSTFLFQKKKKRLCTLKKLLTANTLSISFCTLQFKQSISCSKQLDISSVLPKGNLST